MRADRVGALVLALSLAACGGQSATRSGTMGHGNHHGGPHGGHHGGPHGGPQGQHGEGGYTRGQGDRMPHAEWTAEEYAARLEDPARAEWQQPERLVRELGITPGMRVADLGTGSGYLLPFLHRAVGERGRVVAEDIDPELLALVRARIAREGLTTVEPRHGAPEDPRLEPATFDLALLVNAYHHIEDRPTFLRHVRASLAPGRGRFVVVDFRDGDLPMGPPPEHRIPRAQVERELGEAGFTLARAHDFLPYQFVLEFSPR